MAPYHQSCLVLALIILIPAMVQSSDTCDYGSYPPILSNHPVHITDWSHTSYLAFQGYIAYSGGESLENRPIKLRSSDTLRVEKDGGYNVTMESECANITFIIEPANTPGKFQIDQIRVTERDTTWLAQIKPNYPQFDSTEYIYCRSEYRFTLRNISEKIEFHFPQVTLVILELILEVDGSPEDIFRGSNTKQKVKCPAIPPYYSQY